MMLKRLLLLCVSILAAGYVFAQGFSISFNSQSEARFYFYINGQLYNETPVASITINNLDDKDYLFRIVVDDPYAVQVIKSLRPSASGARYNLLFNPVQERIIVTSQRGRQEASPSSASSAKAAAPTLSTATALPAHSKEAKLRNSRKSSDEVEPGTTGSNIHTVRQPVFDD